MTTLWQKVSYISVGITILTCLMIGAGLKPLHYFDLREFLQELDPYDCRLSPDNLGCDLNRPVEQKRIEGQEGGDKE